LSGDSGWKSTARLTGSLLATGVAQSAMVAVDAAVLGRAGVGALAAVGMGSALFLPLALIGTGTMMSIDPLLTQALGAQDKARAARVLRRATALAFLACAVLVPLTLALPFLAGRLEVAPGLIEASGHFLRARALGLPAQLLLVPTATCLIASHRPGPVIASLAIANITNVVANVLFILGGAALPSWAGPLCALPALGARGAGFATSVVLWVQLLWTLGWARSTVSHPAGGLGAAVALDSVWRMLRLGLPIGLQRAGDAAAYAVLSVVVARVGATCLAAHEICVVLLSCATVVSAAVGRATAIEVGRSIGAGQLAAVQRTALRALGIVLVASTAEGLACVLGAAALVGLFTSDAGASQLAITLSSALAVFIVLEALQAVALLLLRSAGDTVVPAALSAFCLWALSLPVAVIMGLQGSLVGLWWGLCAGAALGALALWSRCGVIFRRPIAPIRITGEMPIVTE
jgi:MATE family multidrug resistance protein